MSEPAAAAERAESIAVIGMAGRFPGAPDLEAFWRNLRCGVESVSFFGDAELLAAGVEPALLAQPSYVKARPCLEGIDLFDAEFFAVNPREAELMDPQHRLFLECAWQALEDAGYAADQGRGWVGVFAGVAQSDYRMANLAGTDGRDPLDGLQLQIATDKDHLATRVSYKLDLKGPSLTVQTACSTGLVAVDLARQSLLTYGCDLALAGAVTVRVPQVGGYLWRDGGVLSPDGHCRAFDARARGTLFGSGVAVVVLKRLGEALADRDAIRAVLRGSAVNNDGAAKVGYTAPSVDGQATVISMAQGIAGVEPDTVSYVEAHGTATPLGDQLEISALTRAFRARTDRRGFCAIGSVKTNLGHLETAAGLAGLIKTVLALEHRQIPPSLHCESPHPDLDLASSPFRVADRLTPWPEGPTPRRAGVSSFGMGGTNAHVVLEEAPAPPPAAAPRERYLVPLSARTPTALAAAATRLADHLERHPELELADVAYTLAVGRRPFRHRRVGLCRDRDELIAELRGDEPGEVAGEGEGPPVVFLFPGQGAQRTGMGAGLYRAEPLFRAELDRCADLFAPHLGHDLRRLLGCAGAAEPCDLTDTRLAQPALFAVEYALARLLLAWGVRPEAMLGHSLGDWVAACLAGVVALPDAVRLVALRGALMAQAPPGAMLAVALPEGELLPRLGERLALAAVNAPRQCTLSGPADEVSALRDVLRAEGVECQLLATSHAFHSPLMEPVLAPFRAAVESVELRPPEVPFVSSATGRWITAEEATAPEFWVRHLRQTVRFAAALELLLAEPERLCVEVGPGRTLAALAAQQPRGSGRPVLPTFAGAEQPEDAGLLALAGRLWQAGVPLDWAALHAAAPGRRVPLPTYPFERRRHWIDPPAPRAAVEGSAVAPAVAAPPPDDTVAVSAPAAGTRPRVAAAAAEGGTAQVVAQIWRQVLGVEWIGLDDNFFSLGGHSLVATQLVGRIGEAFAIDLPLSCLSQAPTVRGLARVVDEIGGTVAAAEGTG